MFSLLYRRIGEDIIIDRSKFPRTILVPGVAVMYWETELKE